MIIAVEQICHWFGGIGGPMDVARVSRKIPAVQEFARETNIVARVVETHRLATLQIENVAQLPATSHLQWRGTAAADSAWKG